LYVSLGSWRKEKYEKKITNTDFEYIFFGGGGEEYVEGGKLKCNNKN
jgi:hypothetical protein